jgi:hypothetical protein
VLTEESSVRVSAPGVAAIDTQVIQGRIFRRWTGTVSSPGVLRLTLPGLPLAPPWLVPGLIALLALGLLAGAWYGLGRRAPHRSSDTSPELVQAIAALDARFLGRREEMAAEDWAAYQAERARLKRELESALAAGDGNP